MHLHYVGKRAIVSAAKRGFSLLELSVVLAIIGVVLAGGLAVGIGAMEASRVNETVSRMDTIHKALLNYSTGFSRMPCPSSLTLTESNANYGVEAANKGTCTGGTPAANFTAASGTVEGGVPTRTLQLSDEYMYDGWGRRFRYSVNPDKTADSSMPFGTGTCSSSKSITVKDAAASDRSTNGVYALISHGANGHGGYTRNGVVFNGASTNTDEQTNCHCNATAVATTYSPTYVQKLPTANSASQTDAFDDIVSYREGWQMQTFGSPLSSTACGDYVYITEYGNCRVQVFTNDGTFVRKFGTCGDGAQNGTIINGGASGVVVDSSGNVFLAAHNGVQKWDSNGNYVTTWDYYWGSGTDDTTRAMGLGMDASGNLYVGEGDSNFRIKKYNSSGVVTQIIGGGASCQSCVSTSSCTCIAGTTDGMFANTGATGWPGPIDIKFDSSGNMYVLDDDGRRVQKFNSAGVYQSQIGGCASGACSSSSANGAFSRGVYGLAIDSSGNIFVADEQAQRVQKFNSAGVYQSQIGSCSSGSCSNGTAAGSFDMPNPMAIDSQGRLWVNDFNNNRVQVFNSSGAWVMTIPSDCANSACSASTANGRFDGPNYITISPYR